MTNRTALAATVVLLLLTAAWGSTFFMVKDLAEHVPVMDYLVERFSIATLAVFLLAPRAVFRLSRAQLWQSVVLGLLYGIGQVMQTKGLDMTTAAMTGFLTGLYVILTPVFAAPILRTRIGRVTWVGVAIAGIGMGVLTLHGFSIGAGELLVVGSAVVYAIQIVGLEAWSKPEIAIGSSVVQLLVITVVCGVFALPNGLVLPHSAGDWTAVLYMAVIVGGLGLLGQVWAQAHLPATRAAIVMAMEPVFAAVFAALFGGETLTGRMLLGGVLVVGAILLVELAPRRHLDAEVTHPAA